MSAFGFVLAAKFPFCVDITRFMFSTSELDVAAEVVRRAEVRLRAKVLCSELTEAAWE